MNVEHTTLVMAGAREAHALVTGLVSRGRRVIASLPEPERMFDALPVPTRVGLFDGPRSFANWLLHNNVGVILDASHAFDDDVCDMARTVAAAQGLAYLRLLRPPWTATAHDIWQHVASLQDAAAALPRDARVFANTGWQSLGAFAEFKGRKLYLRQTGSTARPPPFDFVECIEGQPPFSQFQEEDLFRRLGVTHLVCRNVGGPSSMSKLLAARALRLPVIMVDRQLPAQTVPQVETVAEALSWEAALWHSAD